MKRTVVIIVLFLAFQVLGGIIALLVGKDDFLGIGIGMGVSDVLLAVVLWASQLIRRNAVPSLHATKMSSVLWAVAAMLLLALSLTLLMAHLDLDDGGTTEMFEAMKGNWFCVLTLCLIGPITEELTFREGLQRTMAPYLRSPYAAIALASLVFAAAHMNWLQGVPAFVSGLLLGYFYLRTGDIVVSGTAHVVNNTAAVISLYLPEAEDTLKELPLAATLTTGILLLCASIACAILFSKTLPANENRKN